MEKVKEKSQKWISFFVLMLGAGTIYKLYFMDSAFYVQMQDYFNLSHTEIGVVHSVAGWVSTFGFLAAIYITDRFSKRKMIPFAMIGNGIAGLWLSTFPSFPIIVLIFCLFAIFSDMLFWPTMLKSIRLLGNKDEQGRMFGFLETGRGLIDTIVNFIALGIFVALGSNAFGFKGAIIFFSLVTIFIGVWSYFVIEDDINESLPTQDKNKQAFDGMKEALGNKDIWLVAINIFTVYAVYSGIKYFVPFLKDIYGIPVALVSIYGIVNSYCLKMVGGPIGGYASDKLTHSATKFIRIIFTMAAISLFVFILLPHDNLSVIVGMGFAFLISTFTFCMRAVFFAPMEEVKVPRRITGAAMSLGSFIGYLPGAFMGIIYGRQLDLNPGLEGYKLVFITMGVISVCGIIVSSILIRVISKKESMNG